MNIVERFFIWQDDVADAGLIPCGMFTPGHIISTLILLLAVGFTVYFSRGMSEKKLDRITGMIAVVTAVLEVAKIAFNWINGGFLPHHWLPLAFCSLAIYAYFMIAFGRGKIHTVGVGFMVGGGLIAGLTFLVFPMTSLVTYPLFHFLSFHSMLYHSLMLYVGLAYYVNGYGKFDKIGYLRYLGFAAPACLFALAVNLVYGIAHDITLCNMMFLVNPYRLADLVPFIGTVYEHIPAVYTLSVLAVYLTVPFFVPWCVDKAVVCIREKFKRRT